MLARRPSPRFLRCLKMIPVQEPSRSSRVRLSYRRGQAKEEFWQTGCRSLQRWDAIGPADLTGFLGDISASVSVASENNILPLVSSEPQGTLFPRTGQYLRWTCTVQYGSGTRLAHDPPICPPPLAQPPPAPLSRSSPDKTTQTPKGDARGVSLVHISFGTLTRNRREHEPHSLKQKD